MNTGEIKRIVVNGREYGIEDEQARQMIAEEIAKVIGGAPETFDTLREIADYIEAHGLDMAEIIAGVKANAKDIKVNADAITDEVTRATQAENDIKANAMQYNTLGVATHPDKAEIYGRSINTDVRVVELPAATTEKAGVMTAEDKKALDTATSRALRALFIAVGAEYNDTGVDKTKTAPWGETVTHKAGHYYLNGLGDITEGQMMDIYNAPHNAIYPLAYTGYANNKNVRTLILKGTGGHASLNNGSIASIFNSCLIETLDFISIFCINGNLDSMFRKCTKLTHIKGTIYCQNCSVDKTFDGCANLKTVDVQRLSKNISFLDSPLITKESVLHMIQKALPTSAITITLHADAYARLAEDADIVAALAAQPLITLVSA